MPAHPPIKTVAVNTWEFLREPMIAPTGFREYDARWKYPDEINLPGMQALGLGIGTQMHEMGVAPHIAVGNDYRDYSLAIKYALMTGLSQAGITCHDIGPALSPMAYFSQFHLDLYIADLVGDFKLSRPLKVVCACGNGTAAAFGPRVLEAIGAEVIPLHTELDYTFPHYNPNPEAMEMLHDMADAVKKSGADLAIGFDGDGDRCGVVDNTGDEIFADKMGVIMARDLAALYPGSTFVADVKSTGLYASDPVLKEHNCTTDYWKTGHSYMKRRVHELGALAGFEKSGHYFLSGDIGRGYDCGMRVAVEVCKLMDRNPDKSMSDLKDDLQKTYTTPTLSPFCPDLEKYEALEKIIADLEVATPSSRDCHRSEGPRTGTGFGISRGILNSCDPQSGYRF